MRSPPSGFMTEAAAPPPDPATDEISQTPPPTRRLLVFEVGGSAFAADMSAVREMVPTQPVTRLPGAPPSVAGLINLRGTIVTVLDAGVLLGKDSWRRQGGLVLLAAHRDRVIGVGIDDVRDIHDATEDQFSDGGEKLSHNPIFCGAVDIAGERVQVLDMRTMVREVLGQEEAA